MASYTMQDLLFGVGGSEGSPNGGMVGKLSYRQDVYEKGGLQKLADAILELSRNYRFQGLERTGPVVTLIAGQCEYPISFFTNEEEDIVNLIPSFYMNYTPTNLSQTAKSGTALIWKSIDSLELMIGSYPGTPAYFSRYQDSVYVAPPPTFANTAYMRYQVEHPFSQPVALTDPFMLPDDWRDIAEYAGALRWATDTRMLDYASQYHNLLFGDPKAMGDVGIIARKITQIEGDSTSNTAMRSIRVSINRY